ncbi:MAG: DUF3990 domain-containing protein [Treponema sp.]|nr:DUF3990 domain-containing protein [Treponema sp.]
MPKISLFHGSQKIISKPVFGAGKAYNDYGLGFYCTQNSELAKEWACPSLDDGFSNWYELETEGLRILDLQSGEFCTLHWLAILVTNRLFDFDTPIMRQGMFYLKNNFLPDISDFDAIKGYRADDSYFSFARAFLSNQISYSQLENAMKLGKLGEQFVLKSQKAFDLIEFKGYEIAEGNKYYALRSKRMEKAKEDYKKSLENADISGIFIRDLILQEVKNDDPRLR